MSKVGPQLGLVVGGTPIVSWLKKKTKQSGKKKKVRSSDHLESGRSTTAGERTNAFAKAAVKEEGRSGGTNL